MVWLILSFIGGLDFLSFPDAPPVEGTGVSYTRWWAGASTVRAEIQTSTGYGGLRYFDFGSFSFQTTVWEENPLRFRPYALEGWVGKPYELDDHLTFFPSVGGYLFASPEYHLQGLFLHARFRYTLTLPSYVPDLRPVFWGGVDYLGVNSQTYAELVDLPQIFFSRLDLTYNPFKITLFWRSIGAYGNTTWWSGKGVEKGIRLHWIHPRLQVEVEWRDGRELDPWRVSLAVPYGPWIVFYRHIPTRGIEDLFQMGVVYRGRSGI